MVANNISLSIIVPCYNEEVGIRDTLLGIVKVLDGFISDYEVLVVEDKSTDNTLAIANEIAAQFPDKIKVHSNEVNQGLGYNFRIGFKLATKNYVILVPGDNELNSNSIVEICKHASKADLVVSYPGNFVIRPFFRKLTSTVFTKLMNFISGYNLRYYNGTVLYKRTMMTQIKSTTKGFAFQAEILIQLLKNGATVYEMPFQLNVCTRKSSAFRLKNIISVFYTVLRLITTYRIFFAFKKPQKV